jgi:hypothetical protein
MQYAWLLFEAKVLSEEESAGAEEMSEESLDDLDDMVNFNDLKEASLWRAFESFHEESAKWWYKLLVFFAQPLLRCTVCANGSSKIKSTQGAKSKYHHHADTSTYFWNEYDDCMRLALCLSRMLGHEVVTN